MHQASRRLGAAWPSAGALFARRRGRRNQARGPGGPGRRGSGRSQGPGCARHARQERADRPRDPEGKEEGEVGVSQFDDIEHGDYVLCRNNLPLVGVYINLLRKGIKCHILGSDYGKDLLNIIGKVKNDNLEEGLVDLQVKKLLTLKEKGIQNPLKNQGF